MKKLEWTNDFKDVHLAKAPFGLTYRVIFWYHITNRWSVRLNGSEFDIAEDLEKGKQLCQEHFENEMKKWIENGN